MSAPEELRVPGYEILAKIAEGASSVVYRARCVRTEREAAIKVPLPHADLERLLNGLRAHASLSHPNIVSLWEADQLPGGRAYVTMSLIKGRTLAEIVRDRGAPLEDRDRFVVAFDGQDRIPGRMVQQTPACTDDRR